MVNRAKNNKASKLSADDKDLWRKLADSVSPLKARRSPFESTPKPILNHALMAEPSEADKVPSMAELLAEPNYTQPQKKKKSLLGTTAPSYSPELNKPKSPPPPSTNLQRQTSKALAKGKIPINATLDLHGYTQDQAHRVLTQFITENYAKKRRYLLVITGKGLNKQGKAHAVGVLKKQVPNWLRTGPLSQMVNSFDLASPNHGGSGALYVQLNKPK